MIYREQRSYASLRKELENKPLLALLTDEGFLPNYSFPESGVTLKSVLYGEKNVSDNAINASEDLPPLTYERPANLAIRELVPNGQFYAQGRRVTVDQVDPNLNQTEMEILPIMFLFSRVLTKNSILMNVPSVKIMDMRIKDKLKRLLN